jgi:hypothetical protein
MSEVIAYKCLQCGRTVNHVTNALIGTSVNKDGEEVFTYGETYIFACECKAPIEEVG